MYIFTGVFRLLSVSKLNFKSLNQGSPERMLPILVSLVTWDADDPGQLLLINDLHNVDNDLSFLWGQRLSLPKKNGPFQFTSSLPPSAMVCSFLPVLLFKSVWVLHRAPALFHGTVLAAGDHSSNVFVAAPVINEPCLPSPLPVFS